MRQHPIRVSVALVVVAITVALATWTFAQTAQQDAPVILTGTDIGFRVDRQRTQQVGKLSGTWVVRFNGQWTEPEGGARALPLTTH
jgi:hypothetical protein